MSVIKFTETVYKNAGKKGILTPDENGYYELVVGGLNVFNSAGEYYTAEEAISLFEGSSQFMRRVKNGALYGEVGHPARLPGMTFEDLYRRTITIDERNICAHFSDVFLDTDFGRKHKELNNDKMIAIIAKVKPAGPKANALQLALENPKQNSAFSVRGLTENKFRNNRVERRLTNIVTFDFVTEPGIAIADKVMSPALEKLEVSEVVDEIVDVDVLKRVVNDRINSPVCTESNHALFTDILNSLGGKKASRLSQW